MLQELINPEPDQVRKLLVSKFFKNATGKFVIFTDNSYSIVEGLFTGKRMNFSAFPQDKDFIKYKIVPKDGRLAFLMAVTQEALDTTENGFYISMAEDADIPGKMVVTLTMFQNPAVTMVFESVLNS